MLPTDVARQDDASALSLPALRRWCRILRVFTAEYLALAPEDMVKRTDHDRSQTRDVDELVSQDLQM
jgi:hypothetical protein